MSRLRNRLRDYRARTRLIQAELGEAAEASRRTINNVENGIFVPSSELALRLAHVLDASVEELFFLEPADGPEIG
ncbi:MAG: putative transcriptional regulator [Sphingomonadales bacterium]|jgi:putative transcriptional regulator|nr:putative transcriptional regulator [Sphingomonadales bacterium]